MMMFIIILHIGGVFGSSDNDYNYCEITKRAEAIDSGVDDNLESFPFYNERNIGTGVGESSGITTETGDYTTFSSAPGSSGNTGGIEENISHNISTDSGTEGSSGNRGRIDEQYINADRSPGENINITREIGKQLTQTSISGKVMMAYQLSQDELKRHFAKWSTKETFTWNELREDAKDPSKKSLWDRRCTDFWVPRFIPENTYPYCIHHVNLQNKGSRFGVDCTGFTRTFRTGRHKADILKCSCDFRKIAGNVPVDAPLHVFYIAWKCGTNEFFKLKLSEGSRLTFVPDELFALV